MSTSGSVNFQGLGSGIDFGTIITSLKEAEEIPKKQMEGWHNDWEKRYNAFEEVLKGFKELEESLEELNSVGKIIEKKANSSEEDVATAEASADAENGTTSITVNKLATNAVLSFEGKFSKDTVVTRAAIPPVLEEFTYSYEGEEHVLRIPTGTTMEELVNQINADPKNPGVSASLLKSGDKYIFQFQGDDTGADATLTFDPTNNLGMVGLDSHKKRDAQDAEFFLNGWEENLMTSSTNTLEEVVKGLEITIIAKGTTDFTVTQSTEGIKEKIEDFVDATNKLLKLFEDVTRIDAENIISDTNTETEMKDSEDTEIDVDTSSLYGPQGGVLTGNYGIQMVQSQFKSILTNSFLGSAPYDSTSGYGENFRSLASIGIITDIEDGSDTFGQLIFYERDDEDDDGEITKATSTNLTFDKTFQLNEEIIGGVTGATPPNLVDFTYSYKDKDHTVQVAAGATGATLRDAINNDPENPGVTALFSGSVSDGGYKFSLQGNDTGEEADLDVDTTLLNVNIGDYRKTEAKDAVMDPFRTLDEILENDALAVANILAGNETSTSSPYFTYNSKLDSTKNGLYDVSYEVDSNGNISDVMIGGQPATKNYEAIGSEWSVGEGDAAGLSITIHPSPEGTHTGTIGLQEGKVSEMLGFLEAQTKTNDVNLATPGAPYEKGTLIILMDNYETIMENIQKKIDRETERLIRWEAQQRENYARLDTLLMGYNNQMTSNTDQLAKLNSIDWSR